MNDGRDIPDLLDHIADRLGADRREALHVLADWLTAYQPERHYPIDFSVPAPRTRRDTSERNHSREGSYHAA